jgi:hypothetical protein
MFDARVHFFRFYRNIMQHGEENTILYPLHHGFRKGRYRETQLIEFVDDISKNLQEGRQTDSI